VSDDRKEIERLHSNAVDRINDDLIAFQDATYELGRKKGQAESESVWHALASLVKALEVTSWSSWQSTATFSAELDYASALLKTREAKP
jgi:hypothetical protein